MSATNPSLEYRLTQADRDAFARHITQAPALVRRIRRMRLVWAVVFTVIAIEYGRTAPLGALGFVAIAIAYLACYGPLNRSLSLRQMRGLPAGVSGPDAGPVTLTLTAGRLELTAPDGTVLLPPSPVRRTDESAGHYFLYVAPSAAIIVPRSGVAKGDPGDFIRAVRASRAPS